MSSVMIWANFWFPLMGCCILCAPDASATLESFQVYLLGQALSYALVKNGFEPLHATAIETNGEAAAFLGSSGYGKSTLAACFLAAGHELITDDLLLLKPGLQGLEAYPGPARIKLFPRVARRFFRKWDDVAMNLFTQKRVIPFSHSTVRPLLLRVIYCIAPPRENRCTRKIDIVPLSAREAFFSLVQHTFNNVLVDPGRLQRQIRENTRLVSSIPIKKLSYPRDLDQLPAVRAAILADVQTLRDRAQNECS